MWDHADTINFISNLQLDYKLTIRTQIMLGAVRETSVKIQAQCITMITRATVIWQKATSPGSQCHMQKKSCPYLLSCSPGGSMRREVGPGCAFVITHFGGMGGRTGLAT